MTWIKESAGKDKEDQMIRMLEMFDGYGMIFEDEDLVRERIREIGLDWVLKNIVK